MKKPVPLVARRVADALNRANRDAVFQVRTADQDTSSVVHGFVSTGCSALDYYLGRGAFRGGYPLGRVVELFGPESAGKTTMAIHALISAQRGRVTCVDWKDDEHGMLESEVTAVETPAGVAVLLDYECSFDRVRAQRMGLDLANLSIIDDLETLEDGFEAVESLLDIVAKDKRLQCVPMVIVWDTIAAAPTRFEIEGEYGANRPGGKSSLMFSAMRKLIGKIAGTKTCLLCVNQMIDTIGVQGYGPHQISPGGRALKFMATYRVQVKYAGKIEVAKKSIGIESVVTVVKAKLCEPFRTVKIPIRFSTGIDDDLALAMFLSDTERFGKAECPVVFAKGRYGTTLKSGKEVSAPLAGRGWTKLLDKHKGLRSRLRRQVREWWAAQQESIYARPVGDSAL